MIDVKVDHNSYYVQGITDLAVMNLQAERRRDKEGEVTIVHSHPYERPRDSGELGANFPFEIPCDEQCRIFEPGFVTRSIFSDIKEPIKEEQ